MWINEGQVKGGEPDLPQLVVDHHIVGFDVAVHDPHAVTVVQSLAHAHETQNSTSVSAVETLGDARKSRRDGPRTFSSSYM